MKHLLLLLLLGCKDHSGEFDYVGGDRRSYICNNTAVKVDLTKATFGQSTNPTDMKNLNGVSQRHEIWMQRIDVDQNAMTSKGHLARYDDDMHGCAFTGTGPNYEVNLAGTCMSKTDTGYYRITATATMPTDFESVELDGWIEVADNDDLRAGPGFVFLSVPMQGIPDDQCNNGTKGVAPTYDDRVPTDPLGGCAFPSCVKAAFAGHGTITSGDATTCGDLLSGHAAAETWFFDDKGRMSSAADTPEAMRHNGVHGLDTCTLDTWIGQRPYPFARYHVDVDANTLELDETAMHTNGTITDVCTVHWTAPLTGC